ncbi:unnamed protein product [Soboliphyme baturini]|uniref:DNA-directed DNA polymerase n=1 Tax=Soboliphyme baturini TaxID=241478 RepID=A0A183IMC8_9BILA|nr:unnamed protein product [Soboliphyme baturini]
MEFCLFTNQLLYCFSEDNLSCTQMGCAAVSSSLSPQEALNVYADLKTAMNGLVLASDLHMVYLVTPVYLADMWTHNFSWSNYFTIWCKLCDTQRRIGELVGVDEAVLVHMRFYNALALFDLLEETPIEVVAEKYGCNRGHLQSLQQQAATFAGMITTFCDRLGWHSLTAVLQGFGERLAFGVKRELTELVKIDGLDRLRARSFHRAGFNTLAKLAQASLKDIAAVLRKAVPFHE